MLISQTETKRGHLRKASFRGFLPQAGEFFPSLKQSKPFFFFFDNSAQLSLNYWQLWREIKPFRVDWGVSSLKFLSVRYFFEQFCVVFCSSSHTYRRFQPFSAFLASPFPLVHSEALKPCINYFYQCKAWIAVINLSAAPQQSLKWFGPSSSHCH